MSKLEKIFEGNWKEIKGKLKKQWGELTDNDIKQIDGSLEELTGKLKELYGYEAAKIEEEITEFFDANDLPAVLAKTKALKGEIKENAAEIKTMVSEYVGDYFERMKSSTIKAEESVVEYCKANPIKTAGLMFVAGFTLAAFITKKN